MKKQSAILFFLMILVFALPACAAKAPAVELLGSEAAAQHLVTHLQAYTDNWDGVVPSSCPDEGCKEYGHVHCYGRRVGLWDTPKKGTKTVSYYPGSMDARVGPDTQFQLVDVVSYKNGFYANIRIYKENFVVINSGFVNADYIGCDCETYETFEEVPAYDYDHPPFTLR